MSQTHFTAYRTAPSVTNTTADASASANGAAPEHDPKSATSDLAHCPECAGDIIADDHDLVCDGCGLLISDTQIDTGPSRRSRSDVGKQPARSSGPPMSELHHDKGLQTNIGWLSKSEYNDLPVERREQLRRMRNSARGVRASGDQRKAYGLNQIARMTTALGYTKADAKEAASIFNRAHKHNLSQGRSLDGLAAASLYISLRLRERPITFDAVTKVANTTKTDIVNVYKAAANDLEIPIPPQHPRDHLGRIASAIDAPTSLRRAADGLLKTLDGTGQLQGRKPVGVAAAALHTLIEEAPDGTFGASETLRVTQRELAEAADVDPMTLRKNRDRFLSTLSDSDTTDTALESSVLDALVDTTGE